MNILMLGRWLPPPRSPVRATREYQFARHLARTHRLTLAFITDNPDAIGAISALRADFGDLEFAAVPRAWKSLTSAVSLASGESCTLSYYRSEALRARLADRLRQTRYDLVFVSSSSMIQYALEVDAAIPLVVDFGDVDSEWWVRQGQRAGFGAAHFCRAEAARLRSAEAGAARRALGCAVTSPQAAEIVRSLAPVVTPTVIPNGVDPAAFDATPRNGKGPTVVLGTSPRDDGELNDALDFCRSIMPLVQAHVPRAGFVVASKDMIPGGEAQARRMGVELVAPLTDGRLVFTRHAVAVAPVRGGFDERASALEPMMAGIPVVGGSEVCQRLQAKAGQDLRVSDDLADFARQVVELLENRELREDLGARGRRFAQRRYAWGVVGDRLEQLLGEVVKTGPAAGPGSAPRSIAAARGG